MKADQKFNAMTRERQINHSRKNIGVKLNGFDPNLQPQDGLVHYGYTGKGWVMWRDSLILGHGWADINPIWFDDVSKFLNEPFKGSTFVDLGFNAPNPDSRSFNRWIESESRINGYEASEARLDRLEMLMEIKRSL